MSSEYASPLALFLSFRAQSRNLLLFSMPRDNNFWVYIDTNEHDSVLYVGMTNDLARRISENRLRAKSNSRNGREQRKWDWLQLSTHAGLIWRRRFSETS